eukprot:4059442-Prymnesium_polylepis.1
MYVVEMRKRRLRGLRQFVAMHYNPSALGLLRRGHMHQAHAGTRSRRHTQAHAGTRRRRGGRRGHGAGRPQKARGGLDVVRAWYGHLGVWQRLAAYGTSGQRLADVWQTSGKRLARAQLVSTAQFPPTPPGTQARETVSVSARAPVRSGVRRPGLMFHHENRKWDAKG